MMDNRDTDLKRRMEKRWPWDTGFCGTVRRLVGVHDRRPEARSAGNVRLAKEEKVGARRCIFVCKQ